MDIRARVGTVGPSVMSRILGTVGRPRIIQTPEEFDALVDSYVGEVQASEGKVTMCLTGLCLFLGFASTSSFDNYGKREGFEGFRRSVKRARMVVRHSYEQSAMSGGGAGPIFLLKASYGYQDKVQVEHTGDIKMIIDPEDENA